MAIAENTQPEDDPDIKALMDMGILAVEGERNGLDTRLTLTDFGRAVRPLLGDED
jgi:hypothetical protein